MSRDSEDVSLEKQAQRLRELERIHKSGFTEGSSYDKAMAWMVFGQGSSKKGLGGTR